MLRRYWLANFAGSIVELSLGASRSLGPRATFFVAVVEKDLNTTNAAADATLLVSVKLRSRGS